jgi:uncharacterized protein (TIGR00375 family)
MQVISDLHIHSKYSRACSKRIDIPNLEKWARIKGVDLLGTGDFTHPLWFKHLKETLTEKNGILSTKNNFPFILQTEVSLIYSQGGKTRKVHFVLLSPDFETAEKITEYFKKYGRVDYDGRPIFGIKSYDMVRELKAIDDLIEIIPAHIWTPWFGLFGSKSGFDSVEECFKDQSKHIYALETGLSSDPEMNWLWSKLDKYQLVSSSDSHSFWPWRIGREATVFELGEDFSYKNIIDAIRNKKVLKTVEVDPAYGKYHHTGHRKCNIVMDPEKALENKDICPVCNQLLTVGVMERVKELSDREKPLKPEGASDFIRLLPLSEIISTVLKTSINSKTVWAIYNKMIEKFGNEYNILLKADKEKLKEVADDKIAETIINIREGSLKVKPGFDGVYGVPLITGNEQYNIFDVPKKEIADKRERQKGLGDFS